MALQISLSGNILCIAAFVTLFIPQCVLTTPLNPISQPSPSTDNHVKTCVHLPNWVPSIVNYTDCLEALDIFRRIESAKSSSQRFEFLAPGAHRQTTLLPLHTPRIFYYRTCTVAVSMLTTYPVKYLPPSAKKRNYQSTDVATLSELQDAAKAVVEECVKDAGGTRVGWMSQGQMLSEAIAVTVWETGSYMDNLVRRGPFDVQNGSVGGVDIA